MISIGDQKNKKRIVPSPDVTKSDFTIGFRVVDLVENEVWLVNFLLEYRFFWGWNLKSRVSINKFSKQLVDLILSKIFLSERSSQDLDFHSKSDCGDVILTGNDVIKK